MTSPRTARVLVVDDEAPLARLVADYLARDGLQVAVTGDGLDALERARRDRPDVVVLDLGLPGMDGVDVCRQLRTFSDCFVLMLTARGEELDKLTGLAVGADDYMTKPFSPRELVARVRVLLRRSRLPGAPAGPTLHVGPLVLDPAGREARLDGDPLALTRTEFDLLAVLAGQPHVAFSRRQLIDAVWGQNWVGDERLVDVHIAHLRRKLADDADAGRFIRTVRGVGYRMGTP